MDSIFKDKAEEKETNITDLKILAVLITKLLRQDLNRLINRIKPVEL
jgi:hypothetical protein